MVCYMTLYRSANHPNKSVVGTPTVSYNTLLVWYAHFIFYSVYQLPCKNPVEIQAIHKSKDHV